MTAESALMIATLSLLSNVNGGSPIRYCFNLYRVSAENPLKRLVNRLFMFGVSPISGTSAIVALFFCLFVYGFHIIWEYFFVVVKPSSS